MSGKDKRFWTRAFPVAGAVIALVAVGGASYAHVADGREDTRCAITSSGQGGMVTIEGLYHAEKAGSGTYSFEVHSSGGSNRTQIRQGGGFSAQANDLVHLGQATLGGSGGVYDATLTVEFAGETVKCTGRVGGRLV